MISPPPNSRVRYTLDADFFRWLADAYYQAVNGSCERCGRSGEPAPVIGKALGVSPRTVHRWIYLARKGGYLPPGEQGRASRRPSIGKANK